MVRRFWPKTIIIMRPATCRDDSRRLPAAFVLDPTGRKRHPFPAVSIVKGYWRVAGTPIMHMAASNVNLRKAGYTFLYDEYVKWLP